jgi:hypothetical protein
MDENLDSAERNIEALQTWFGPTWRWVEMALWIEARSRSSNMPRFAVNWAIQFLETRRIQEEAWKK